MIEKNNYKIYWPILMIMMLLSCMHEPSFKDPNQKCYVFLGHIYKDPSSIDDRLLKKEFDIYDGILLGGDITTETTKNPNTIEYLDRIFSLNDPSTLWTLGNHDIRNGNIDFITEATGRPTFYTHSENGLTFLVLNTNLNREEFFDRSLLDEQFNLIQTVCDSIQHSSHLIVLSHHWLWKDIVPLNHTQFANVDGSWLPFQDSSHTQYSKVIFPLFQNVQAKGIQVMHIAGDMGQNRSSYEFVTDEGIVLLASGITANTSHNKGFQTVGIPDSILVLNLNLPKRRLHWTFEQLN